MSVAILSLTEQGRVLSRRIAGILPDARRYCFHRHTDSDAIPFSDLAALTAQLFPQCRALIFLAACGITVRMIAPHLRSKQTDPAVLVVDGSGRFVIPLLSGHIGGANALAVRLADALGAQAVLTTGTDVGGVFSPDCFAKANQLLLTDFTAAKELAAAALAGETIGIVSELPYCHLPPSLSPDASCRTGLFIGTEEASPFPVTLRLVPRNLVLGIGCKRGAPEETIAAAVASACRTAHLSAGRICAVSTIDWKADEPGLLAFCKKREIPLFSYSAQALMQVQGTFTSSAFVQQITGADNICERSAVLHSGGNLLLPKTACSGVTVAIAEMPLTLDFERNVL